MENENKRQSVRVDHFREPSLSEIALQAQSNLQTVPRSTSGFAVTALILGILSILGGGVLIIPPILAVVFGHVAVSACGTNPYLDGKGLGIAGLVMGWLCLAGWIIFILFLGGLAALAAAIGGAFQ